MLMFSFVVRYDAIANQLTEDVSHLMKILRRRYFVFAALICSFLTIFGIDYKI